MVQRTTPEIVADNVRRLRHERGWNQTELGRAIGKPQSRVSEIESGKLHLSGPLIDKLADAFDVKQAELFSEAVEENLQEAT